MAVTLRVTSETPWNPEAEKEVKVEGSRLPVAFTHRSIRKTPKTEEEPAAALQSVTLSGTGTNATASKLGMVPSTSAVVVQVVEQDLAVGAQRRAAAQAVQAARRRAAVHQLVVLQVLQAKRWRAALHHQHLDFGAVRRTQQPPLAPLHRRRHFLRLLRLLLYFLLFLFRLLLLLIVVNLPQQIVDEDGASQVGLGVLQEPELLQGQFENAAAVLLQYQVLKGNKQKAALATPSLLHPVHASVLFVGRRYRSKKVCGQSRDQRHWERHFSQRGTISASTRKILPSFKCNVSKKSTVVSVPVFHKITWSLKQESTVQSA